jgi:hypothetical protein
MPKDTSIKIVTDPNGLIDKATVNAPDEGIKIKVVATEDYATYTVEWEDFSATITAPYNYISSYYLRPDAFKDFFGKPYHGVYWTIFLMEHALFLIWDKVKKLQETGECEDSEVNIKTKTNEDGYVEKAIITAPECDFSFEMTYMDDVITLKFKYGDVSVNIVTPYRPEYAYMLSEKAIRAVYTDPCNAILTALSDIQRILLDYRDEAKDLSYSREYSMWK